MLSIGRNARASMIAAWPRARDRARKESPMSLAPHIARAVGWWQRKKPLWITLGGFFLSGVLLIHLWESGIPHEIGVALLISALLGFSIDFYLRRSIARDAFEGAMGYFLPEDIKEAVQYIGAMDWFAEEFTITVKLEKAEHGLIKCTIRLTVVSRRHFFFVALDWRRVTGTMMAALGGLRGFVGERCSRTACA